MISTAIPRKRAFVYIAVAIGLTLGYIAFRGHEWQGSVQLHTVMEAIATLLAATVGAMALVRFYSRQDNTFLLIGTGFLGTAFLDGYHAVVTSAFFKPFMLSDLPSLIPWSWVASRQFLSIFMFFSFLAWLREERHGAAGRISDKTAYLFTSVFTLASFLFFAFVPLPRAYYPEIAFHRPEEFAPALFFLLALIGYLWKGSWKTDVFEHWLVLSLVVGLVGQAVFMSFSGRLFDLEFDLAHTLKKVSYVCVLTGLLIGMFHLFRRVEESEARFRDFAGIASDWMWEMDAGLRFTFVSERFEEIFGAPRNFILGKRRDQLDRVDADNEKWYEHFADLEARRPIRNFEYKVRHPDGSIRDVPISGTPVFDNDGTFLGYRGTATDTTVLKQAEDATRRSEERFRGAIENLQEGFALFDADDRLVIFNEKYYELHPAAQDILKPGLRFEDIVRNNVAKGIIAEAVGREEEHIEERIEQHRNPSGPIVRELTNGVWYIINEARTPEGGIAVTETEITDLKVAEAHVRESEERTRAIVDNVLDGIITINEDGVVRSVNPAAELIFGYPAGELIGQNVKMLAPKSLRAAHDGYIANYIETGETEIIGTVRELEGQRRSGDVFPMELAISEVRTDRDRFFVGIVRDITRRKEIDRMKSEFVSTVSHELRTPLTSIHGSLGLVTGGAVGEVPAQARDLIEIAGKNCERLIALVNDILDMEKIESGRMEYKFDLVDLDILVEQAIRANQAYGSEFDVAFVLTDTETGARVQGDGERLTQVLANLLSNAAKFSPAGEDVGISITRNDGAFRVSVKDSGNGVPEEFRDRIFEKFSQADSSDARQGGGTGLGLSISRAIIEKHGGRLDFDSKAGEGATFYFDLPVWQEKRIAAASTTAPKGHRQRVLICEDDPDIAALLALMLEQGGYVIDIAYNAKDAKKRAEELHYDAMTVDIMLPDQDGIALIRELRETDGLEDMATVVVSVIAKEARNDVSTSAMGIVDWLDKPIDQDRLLAAVQQAVRSRTNGKPGVLYVEDDPDLVEVVRTLLGDEVDLVSAGTLGDANANVRNETFDLVIIDILLPDGSGLDLLHTLRTNGHQSTPVVIFSGQDVDRETAERVEAALVKSRTSNDELLETVRALIGVGNRTKG